MERVLAELGEACEHTNGTTTVTTGDSNAHHAPYELVRTMRASVLVLGPLLARRGRARVALPGGCAIGARPIDLHLDALARLGAEIRMDHGDVVAAAPSGLVGTDITFPRVTVTGTENLVMAACLARGRTTLRNCAREPEVADLVTLLRGMGADIRTEDGDTLVVELFWPDALYAEQPDIHLTTVSHGYKPFGSIGRKTDDDVGVRVPGSAGSCNIDTTCPEADEWQDQKRGAVMVLSGGSGVCSGALVNTTANDCRTYLLTASHCGEDGPSTTIGFNYECPTCGCTTDPGTTVTLGKGVAITGFESDFPGMSLESDDDVGLMLRVQNQGELDAETGPLIAFW